MNTRKNVEQFLTQNLHVISKMEIEEVQNYVEERIDQNETKDEIQLEEIIEDFYEGLKNDLIE